MPHADKHVDTRFWLLFIEASFHIKKGNDNCRLLFYLHIALYNLVVYFSVRCGHCKRLKPEFEKASTTLKNNDPPVILAKVSGNMAVWCGSPLIVKTWGEVHGCLMYAGILTKIVQVLITWMIHVCLAYLSDNSKARLLLLIDSGLEFLDLGLSWFVLLRLKVIVEDSFVILRP